MSVITPIELQDFGLARHASRQANGTHGRLRATGNKPNAFGEWVIVENHAAQFILEACWRSKRSAIGHRLEDSVLDNGVRVAQNQRTPRTTEIDVFLTIGIPNVRP